MNRRGIDKISYNILVSAPEECWFLSFFNNQNYSILYYTTPALTTYFSLSPSHLDTRSEDLTEKNVELLASVATAFAKKDFPVPGGCKEETELRHQTPLRAHQ